MFFFLKFFLRWFFISCFFYFGWNV
jgi:hypothetical protein